MQVHIARIYLEKLEMLSRHEDTELITACKHSRLCFCWPRTVLLSLGPAPAARARAGTVCAEAASSSKQRGIARNRKKHAEKRSHEQG